MKNRQIKFRAWDKLNSEMTLFLLFEKPTACWGKHFEIMQFTGLKDSTGKEIYEGDYLQDEPDGEGFSILHRVVWMEDRLRFEIETWHGEDDWDYGDYDELWDYAINMKLKDFRVVGNIYQNPELIK